MKQRHNLNHGDEKTSITMVTCTYNSEEFLKKALKSVEIQTNHNIEHIINDSYSTDRTLEIINQYMQRNQENYPIKLIHTESKGVANALNKATEAATGDIIHYLHSDDYYIDQHALSKVVQHFKENPTLVWLTGNFLIEIKGEQIIIPHTHLIKNSPQTAISVMNFIHHENTFMKRTAVAEYGGFCEDKSLNVEYRLWLRLIRDHQPLIVNDQFTVFIIHKGSTSTGNIIQFSKAIGRGIKTLQSEKIFPLIGCYEQNRLYKNSQNLLAGVQARISSIFPDFPKNFMNQ